MSQSTAPSPCRWLPGPLSPPSPPATDCPLPRSLLACVQRRPGAGRCAGRCAGGSRHARRMEERRSRLLCPASPCPLLANAVLNIPERFPSTSPWPLCRRVWTTAVANRDAAAASQELSPKYLTRQADCAETRTGEAPAAPFVADASPFALLPSLRPVAELHNEFSAWKRWDSGRRRGLGGPSGGDVTPSGGRTRVVEPTGGQGGQAALAPPTCLCRRRTNPEVSAALVAAGQGVVAAPSRASEQRSRQTGSCVAAERAQETEVSLLAAPLSPRAPGSVCGGPFTCLPPQLHSAAVRLRQLLALLGRPAAPPNSQRRALPGRPPVVPVFFWGNNFAGRSGWGM